MELTIIIAFVGGLISFLSPCILPLIIPYISYISGIPLNMMRSKTITFRDRKHIFFSSLFFVSGFTIIFLIFGIVASIVGGLLANIKSLLSRIVGIVIFILGIHMVEIIRISFLDMEKRINPEKLLKWNYLSSFLIGTTFAFGWTPCIGPILGSIIGLATYGGNILYGSTLLVIYSLGLALPFLITALFISEITGYLKKFSRASLWIERIGGVILIILGILIMLDALSYLSQILINIFPLLREVG